MTLKPTLFSLPPATVFEGVTVVIPVYNALDYAAGCIASLYTVVNATQFEVVVVDNGSVADNALLWLERERTRPNFWFARYDVPLGFAGAVNVGVRHARGRYVVILNSDTVVTDGWLDALVAAMDRDASLAVISPMTNHAGGELQIDIGAASLRVEESNQYAGQIRARTQLIYTRSRLTFFGVMVRRAVWELIGGLDEGYRTGNYEDDDYCLRVQLAGYRLAVATNSFIYHYENTTFKENKLDHGAWMSVNERRFYDRASRLAQHPRPNAGSVGDITVLVPVMGGASDDLRRALASLAAQLMRPAAVIVIAPDESAVAPVIRTFASALTISVIAASDATLGTLLDAGRAHIRTRYVNVVRADEVAYPMHLAVLYDLAQKTGARAVYSRWVLAHVGATGELRRGAWFDQQYNAWHLPELRAEDRVKLSCVLHETNCYTQVGRYDISLVHSVEWDFVVRLVSGVTVDVTNVATVERWIQDDPLTDPIVRAAVVAETERLYERYPVTEPHLVTLRKENLSALAKGRVMTDVLPPPNTDLTLPPSVTAASTSVAATSAAASWSRAYAQRLRVKRMQSAALGVGRKVFERVVPSYEMRVTLSNWVRRPLGMPLIPVSNSGRLTATRRRIKTAITSRKFERWFPSTTSRPDVFLFSIIEWSALTQRPQHFARKLAARGYRVFWVDTDLKRIVSDAPWWGDGALPQLAPGIHLIQFPGTMERVYPLPLQAMTDGTFAAALDFVRHLYGIEHAVCLVNFLKWTPLVLEMRERYGWKIVYDCLDNAAGFSDLFGTNVDQFEETLVRASDRVIASAQYLVEHIQPYTSAAPVLVRNAVDYDLFSTGVSRGLLDALPHPIIGFFGAFSDWLDLDLIEAAAQRYPAWSFVFIGRSGFANVDNALHWGAVSARPNVHVYAQVDLATLAAYQAQFDVCTLPFRDLPITQAMNAVKIYEYLAAGKPVVATDLPETRPLAAQGLIALYRTPDEYCAALEVAVAQGNDPAQVAARQAFAAQNTWDHRVDMLVEQIDALF